MQFLQSAFYKAHLNLDPRTKLLLLFVISTVMISGKINGTAIYGRLILATIPLILLFSSKRIKVALLYTIFFAMAWFAESFLIYNTTGIANIIVVMLSGLVSRFVPCIIMGYYVMATTRVSEFVAAMERMHVSEKIIIPMSVMFRFFPTVVEESRAIKDAMRMRGVGMGNFLNNPIAMFEYRLVPLLMSVVKIGDELTASALTRGLGGPIKRTNICKIGFGLWDFVFTLLVILALVFHMVI